MAKQLSEEDVKSLFKTLRKVNLFSSISVEYIDWLVQQFTLEKFSKGKKIIKEGKPGVAIYIIKSGSCLVSRKLGFFSREKLTTLREGDFFGEMSLVFKDPTSATVETLETSEIFVMSRNDFLAAMAESSETLGEIRRVAEERKRLNA